MCNRQCDTWFLEGRFFFSYILISHDRKQRKGKLVRPQKRCNHEKNPCSVGTALDEPKPSIQFILSIHPSGISTHLFLLLFSICAWTVSNLGLVLIHESNRGWTGQKQVHLDLMIPYQTLSLCVKVDSVTHRSTDTDSKWDSHPQSSMVDWLQYMLCSRRYEPYLGWPFQHHFFGGRWGICQTYQLHDL